MIQVLFSVIFAEMALIVMFVFKTPLRKLVIMGLDRIKRGRGPIVVKTIGGTIFVVMLSTIYSVVSIRKRWIDEDGNITPTDQILMAQHLLEASLMGFSLFLALMVDRLHHYIRELRIRRKSMEAVNKQNRGFEDGKNGACDDMKSLEEEASALRLKIKKLELCLEEKARETSDAEANSVALKKQSENFGLENDSLLEDNQNLRAQLQALDQRLSSDTKKDS
ncbi:uncharacterized protein LOC107787681 [Nicotiana tabacum]|uniref:Endoplasmic reticulum transmembrane protein n=1 Tax=Nicotiana tabacum TaxID=4097 RepID=A0A1S3ZKD4_TOBAC|nr:uncharacterized protein LOC104119606 [Nicotiana tomentosiformis]XP_016464769.1 PREDICTED: uncharacterized protein LOC107787681 [Nicotiana tabacum]